MIRTIEHEGCTFWFVADDMGMPVSFGYTSRETAEDVESLLGSSDGAASIPPGLHIEKILADYR